MDQTQRRILVIDDDRSIRELLRLRLASAGYDVVLAEDAIVAGRILGRERLDMMIVDANLPHVSGVDFVANLVADPNLPWVPVIFITGREDLKEHAESLGSACLVKPFLGQRLLDLVERVLHSQDRISQAQASAPACAPWGATQAA
jgi:two-component system, chemotaxis family, chemotaxis protein CheY